MRSNTVPLWVGTATLFIGIAITGRKELLGAVVGYWLGFCNSAWLYRDTRRSVNLEMRQAISRMRRSFFARLGVVTMVVIGMARFQKGWLPDLAFGIAVGLLVSLVFYVRRHMLRERGD